MQAIPTWGDPCKRAPSFRVSEREYVGATLCKIEIGMKRLIKRFLAHYCDPQHNFLGALAYARFWESSLPRAKHLPIEVRRGVPKCAQNVPKLVPTREYCKKKYHKET